MVTVLNYTIKRCSSASGDEGLFGGGRGIGGGGGVRMKQKLGPAVKI